MQYKKIIFILTVVVLCSPFSLYAADKVSDNEEERKATRVKVVNSTVHPIPVQYINQYPIQREGSAKFEQYLWIASENLYTVPLDKRLIIEYFSCSSSSGSYNTSYSCYITTGQYPDNVHHYLPTTLYGHSAIFGDSGNITNPPALISAGQRVQIYADPGTEVIAGAIRQNRMIVSIFDYPEEYMSFSFSGYLVDITQ